MSVIASKAKQSRVGDAALDALGPTAFAMTPGPVSCVGSLDAVGKIPRGAPSGEAVTAARAVNFNVQNIFNGLLRVPVKTEIPALDFI